MGRAVKGTAETVWGALVTERTEIVLTAVNQDILDRNVTAVSISSSVQIALRVWRSFSSKGMMFSY